MHHFFQRLMGMAGLAAFGILTLLPPAPLAQAQGGQAAQGQPQKKVKDQGEYDLFNGVTKEPDANKRLALLTQWRDKYPDSDYKPERLVYLLTTYQALGRAKEMMQTAKEILVLDPKEINALYWITRLTPQLQDNAPDSLAAAEKAANGLLNAEKPATAKEEDWKKVKQDMEANAQKTLGWVAMQRKNAEQAEDHFKKSLQMQAAQGEVSYWLGTVIVAQRKPEKQSEALFHFARAAALEEKEGGLTAQGRAQVDQYLTKAYGSYHGEDKAGLDELRRTARANAFPPEGFKIKNINEILAEKEEDFKKTNPQLALWLGIKKQLTAADGEQYFETSMKGAAVPKLKGTLINARPAVKSKELVIGLADPNVPEITLKLDQPLAGKPKVGSTLEFEGVPTGFSKEPFMVTFDVEKEKIEGLEVEAAAPVRKSAAPPKKRTSRKK